MIFNYDVSDLQSAIDNGLKFPNKIKVLTSSDNLNDYYTEANSGWYELRQNVVNAPASYCRCLVIGGSGASQVVFTTNHVYVRMYTGDPLAWSGWETIPNYTELTAEATTRSNADIALQNAINALLGTKVHTFSQSFNFNATGSNEYTGASITIPANSVYAITATAYYIASKPDQISINTSSTSANAVLSNNSYVSPVAACSYSGYTASSAADTRYVWAKYANSGANSISISGFYISLS